MCVLFFGFTGSVIFWGTKVVIPIHATKPNIMWVIHDLDN